MNCPSCGCTDSKESGHCKWQERAEEYKQRIEYLEYHINKLKNLIDGFPRDDVIMEAAMK